MDMAVAAGYLYQSRSHTHHCVSHQSLFGMFLKVVDVRTDRLPIVSSDRVVPVGRPQLLEERETKGRH